MQVLLAEKDAELQQLAQRIERMEARRGAMNELQQLDALEARLKVHLFSENVTIILLASSYMLSV